MPDRKFPGLLDRRDAIHHLLEAIGTEKLLLFLLEIFAQTVIFVGTDDAMKGREQDRILAGLRGDYTYG